MTRSNARGDAAVERQRHDLADTTTRRREKSDSIRVEERDLHDRTRHGSQRGDHQALSALRRQRTAVDESIRDERESADLSLESEHALVDETLGREKRARSDAEAATRRGRDRETSQARELEATFVLLEEQLRIVSGSLATMLDGVPRGAFESRLCDDVASVRGATERMRTLLQEVRRPPIRRPRAAA